MSPDYRAGKRAQWSPGDSESKRHIAESLGGQGGQSTGEKQRATHRENSEDMQRVPLKYW